MSADCDHKPSYSHTDSVVGQHLYVVFECELCGATATHEFEVPDLIEQANEMPEPEDMEWESE